MNIKCVKVGKLETNCYILEKDDKCLIIDPGDNFEVIRSNIICEVVGILLTHKHFDHIGALRELLDYYNVQVYDKSNLKEEINNIDVFKFEVIYNPGHTIDSISFIFNDIIFSGDFIFEGTIGRCDLGGDFNLMKDSIRKILKLNFNYKIYPGHGKFTYLNEERNSLNSWIN